MDGIFALLTPVEWAMAFGVALLGGWIKGMVGFALPMIMISGLSVFLTPELALAGLIGATVVANAQQALRQGVAAAWQSIRRFRVFLIVGFVFLMLSAQLVTALPARTLLLCLGVPVTFFALIQLFGLRLRLAAPSARIEALMGSIAGFVGGLSGVWGPPTVLYLTALDTPKGEQLRIQGVIYGLGALALVLAHTGSGVLRAETWPLSLILIFPAMVGTWIGGLFHDRIDQQSFRKVTLLVLTVAGLNLIRRGVMG